MTPRTYPLAERLLRRLVVDDGEPVMEWLGAPSPCWRWTGDHDRHGYGRARDEGGRAGAVRLVHQLTFRLVRGPMPEGMEPDHLCRRRWCAHPFHVEPVTHVENCRRGSRSRSAA